ncbi:hypothetical protein SETIT_3G398800v2 [Setaria italica]|uniref:Uncharacterized protein n=1 Tax=Setaria italica TaxID=4555 RepID=K3ZEE0_SETIT|nr:hypothetical protein SETIT_3G398800v2 [Setaria italica]
MGFKPAAVFLLLVVVALAAACGGASADTFRVTNIGGGTQLNPSETWVFTAPAGTKSGRIWGRAGCQLPLSPATTGGSAVPGQWPRGQGVATGDCAGALRCMLPGNPASDGTRSRMGMYGISVAVMTKKATKRLRRLQERHAKRLVRGPAVEFHFYPSANVTVAYGFNVPMDFMCGAGDVLRCREPASADASRSPDEPKVRTCAAGSDYHVVFCPTARGADASSFV